MTPNAWYKLIVYAFALFAGVAGLKVLAGYLVFDRLIARIEKAIEKVEELNKEKK